MLCAVTSFVTCAHDPTCSYTQRPPVMELELSTGLIKLAFCLVLSLLFLHVPWKKCKMKLVQTLALCEHFLSAISTNCSPEVLLVGSAVWSTGWFFFLFFFFPCLTLEAHTLLCNTIDWNKHGKGDEHSRVHFVLSAYLICKYHMPTPSPHPSFMWV